METSQQIWVEEGDLISSKLPFLVNLSVQESFQHSLTFPLPSQALGFTIFKETNSDIAFPGVSVSHGEVLLRIVAVSHLIVTPVHPLEMLPE